MGLPSDAVRLKNILDGRQLRLSEHHMHDQLAKAVAQFTAAQRSAPQETDERLLSPKEVSQRVKAEQLKVDSCSCTSWKGLKGCCLSSEPSREPVGCRHCKSEMPNL